MGLLGGDGRGGGEGMKWKEGRVKADGERVTCLCTAVHIHKGGKVFIRCILND